MGTKYKKVQNGRGTCLCLGEDSYVSVGADGNDVAVRAKGKVIWFDKWADLVSAIDIKKAECYMIDAEGSEKHGSNTDVGQDT